MADSNGRESHTESKVSYRKNRRLHYTRSNVVRLEPKNHEGHSAGAPNGNQNALSMVW